MIFDAKITVFFMMHKGKSRKERRGTPIYILTGLNNKNPAPFI